jgi:hypothetical protein
MIRFDDRTVVVTGCWQQSRARARTRTGASGSARYGERRRRCHRGDYWLDPDTVRLTPRAYSRPACDNARSTDRTVAVDRPS